MKTYLKETKYQTFKYVRRVPKQLLNYTSTTSFRVSLGSNILEATQQALEFNTSIDEAIQLSALGLDRATIIGKLEHFLGKETACSKANEEPTTGTLKELSSEYLSSQEDNISAEETRDKRYFYEVVCTTIFEHLGLSNNPDVAAIEYKHLLEFKSIITQLPKRNIQRYRVMLLSDILKQLSDINDEDKISVRTVNKYIKWLRALFSFAVMLKHLEVNLANSIPLLKTLDDKLQRLPLESLEMKLLQEAMPQKMNYLLRVLALTGMRLSELFKCEVVTLDGIKCFSLMDRSIKLKTKSSYRVIPVHSSLLKDIDSFEEMRSEVSSNNLAKTTSATIKRLNFTDKEKKSLYSLRHKFATELIQKGADSFIVSELLGHAHTTMTLSRYSTGFSVRQLQEVVELL